MNIYNAIMATADHIERNPDEFKFSAVYIPNSPGCGTPGCALGWIGTFLGVSEARAYEEGQSTATVLHIGSRYLGVLCRDHNDNMNEFYSRMNEFDKYWKIGPQECSKALRLYAAKYHAPTGIPDSVRAIFSEDLKAAPDSLADMAGAPSVGR